MKKKNEHGVGDFEDALSSVPHASGLRLFITIATQRNMHTDHVDISQAFTQSELLECSKTAILSFLQIILTIV